MEFDKRAKRPYSVLTRDGVKENMQNMIGEFSEFFYASRSESTVLLMRYRWNAEQVSERLIEDSNKLLVESGLRKICDVVDSNQALDLRCGVCLKDFDEIDNNDELISTPICRHNFCISCWRKYLNLCFMDKNLDMIACPHKDCNGAVGPVTIERFTVRDKEMYERVLLDSYVEENMKLNKIKKCPNNCEYMIVFPNHLANEEYSLNVVCLCGFTFCWKCETESHRPVTCNNASDWLGRDLKNANDVKTQAWIDTNTRICPSCFCSVQVNTAFGPRSVTCNCSFKFCVKCMKSEEEHFNAMVENGTCVAVELEEEKEEEDTTDEVAEICVDRWEAYQATLDEARKDLKDFDKYLTKKPHSLTEEDIRLAREGLMLIIQCRQVLKWSCVYDFLHTEYETSKKEYLWFLQEHATVTLTGYLKKFLEETEKASKASSGIELSEYRLVITSATSNIGNYFYHFIKTLNEGLVDVKVKSYDGVAGPHWFCDRCTFGNKWIHKNCQMCVDPAASFSGENLSD